MTKEKLQTLDTEDFYEISKEESLKMKSLTGGFFYIARAIKDDSSPDQTMSSILSISGILKTRAIVQLISAELAPELSIHEKERLQIDEIKKTLTPDLLRKNPMDYLWKSLDWYAVLAVVKAKTHAPINVSRTVNLTGIKHEYNLD